MSLNVQTIRDTIARIASQDDIPRELEFGRLLGSITPNTRQSGRQTYSNRKRKWGYGPLVSRKRIRDAEELLEGEFVDEVREFYQRLGDGGPGPGDGILPIEHLVHLTPNLSKRFPHQKAWSSQALLDGIARANFAADYPGEPIEHAVRASQTYCNAKFPGGALVVAQSMGGSYLVVTNGPETGHVWRDSANEIAPLRLAENVPWTTDLHNVGPRIDFATWYMAWLNYAERITFGPSNSER